MAPMQQQYPASSQGQQASSRALPMYAQRGGYMGSEASGSSGTSFRPSFHPPASTSNQGTTSPYRYEGVLQHASPTGQYASQMYASSPQKQGYLPGGMASSSRHPFAMQEQQHGMTSAHIQQGRLYDANESASSPSKSTPSPAAGGPSNKKSTDKRKKATAGTSTTAKSMSGSAKNNGEGASSSAQASSQKRKKKAVSCENCRRRKLKCDRGWPCGACRDRDEAHLCTWEGGTRPQNSGRDLGNAPLLMRLEKIEDLLAQLTSRSDIASTAGVATTSSPVQSKGKTLAKKLTSKGEASTSALKTGSNGIGAASFGLLPVSSKPVSQEQAMAEMWDIMSVLPDTENVRRLCRHYFDEIDFMYYAIDEASFWMVGLREHEELRMLTDIQRSRPIPEKDLKRHLLFLSLLLSICGLTLYFNGSDGFSEAAAHIGHPDCHNILFDASLRAFAAANPHEQPSLLSLRCLILQTWAISSIRGPNTGQALLSAAIHSMYMLGLDVEPPISMPKAQRRDRIRLFYTVAMFDWVGTGIVKRSYMVREEPRKHPYLFAQGSMKDDISDLNDSILLPDMWVKLEMARINRLASDRTGMDDEDAYNATLELQEQLNGVVSDLPPEFEAEMEKERDSVDHATFHRLITLNLVANQLINLHKRFYIKGWHDPKYESSRHICFSSARRICNLFKKTFGHIVPLDKLKNTDIVEVKRIADSKQRQSARLWYFIYACIGACLLLQHHCRLMDTYPDVAGPNASKVRSEILEDLRITKIAMVALSGRSEMARIALTVLSKPNMANFAAQSQTLDCVHSPQEDIDPYRPILGVDEHDEQTRKRRADLAHDLRSITDVDTFATKRVKLQGDDAHLYFRSRNQGRQSDSHEGSATHGTPSSTGRGAGNGTTNSNHKVMDEAMRRIQGDAGYGSISSGPKQDTGKTNGAQSSSEADVQGGNANNGGSSIFGGNQSQQMNYSDMQSLLDSALNTDMGTGMPLAPELAFERHADWMGGGMLPTNFLTGGPATPFMANPFFGNWDSMSQSANASTNLTPGGMQSGNMMPGGGGSMGPPPQTSVMHGLPSLNTSSGEGQSQMPASVAQGNAAAESMAGPPPPQHVQSWF